MINFWLYLPLAMGAFTAMDYSNKKRPRWIANLIAVLAIYAVNWMVRQ